MSNKEYKKEWYLKNKDKVLEANRRLYQKQKETGTTWFQRNKDKINEYNKQYRLKRIAELKAQGIKNPWVVYLKKGEAKYEDS